MGKRLRRMIIAFTLLAWLACQSTAIAADRRSVTIGAKAFTEQEILGELVATLIERTLDITVHRRLGLGGTDICHSALVSGEIDLYVEYTGTALVNVLNLPPEGHSDEIFRRVAALYRELFQLEWFPPIGFDNTYAIAVRRQTAREFGLSRISDLTPYASQLRGGFTAEFAERPDGLPALTRAIEGPFGQQIDLDPGLMYDALRSGSVDIICAFATDPRIDPDVMVILKDDAGLFPPYRAAPVARRELLEQVPELRDALAALAGTIDDDTMRMLNGKVDLDGRRPADVAAEWLNERGIIQVEASVSGSRDSEQAVLRGGGLLELAIERREQIIRLTGEHVLLVLVAMVLAIGLGLPLGILAERTSSLRTIVLGLVEVVQTIPSLAMLAFLFALFGRLGFRPAVAALVLYALLPIVVNTVVGIQSVPKAVRTAAESLGMSGAQRLRRVELPLAAPIILSGIRTSTILCVGVATLSTYIGAGGLGDLIARGLARNDPRLTLLGAIPAALLALAAGVILRGAQWWIDPHRPTRFSSPR